MRISSTNDLTLSALFIAMGLLLPILFHGLGIGAVFLPMFWPVAASVFFLPIGHACLVALLTPVASFVLTGMPPVSPPILYVMMGELVALAAVSAWLFCRTGLGVFWIVLFGMAASRLMLFIFAGIIAPSLGLPARVYSVYSVVKGLPGVVVIMLLVPAMVAKIKQLNVFSSRMKNVDITS